MECLRCLVCSVYHAHVCIYEKKYFCFFTTSLLKQGCYILVGESHYTACFTVLASTHLIH